MKFKFSLRTFEIFLTEFYKNPINVHSLFCLAHIEDFAGRRTAGLRVGFSLFIGEIREMKEHLSRKTFRRGIGKSVLQSMKFNIHVTQRAISYLT
jgi:hypothetical protein